MKKAIFLDKDGTLIEDVPYNSDPGKLILYDDMVEGLRLSQKKGYLLVIISNKPGITHGYFTNDEFESVADCLKMKLEKIGIWVTGVYYCPHLPDNVCTCRKPQPGLLQRAAADHSIDLERCG